MKRKAEKPKMKITVLCVLFNLHPKLTFYSLFIFKNQIHLLKREEEVLLWYYFEIQTRGISR